MNENCITVNGPAINDLTSPLDSTFNFGSDMIYGCTKSFKYTDFVNFCMKKEWKNYVIFNSTDFIQYLGIFGNANYNFNNVRLDFAFLVLIKSFISIPF